MTGMDGASLRLERTFAAPPERVFAAWTKPEVLRHWFAAGPEWTNTAIEVDMRVGGRYRLSMSGPGTVVHTVVGEYLQVDPPDRLVYTWEWEDPTAPPAAATLVTVLFRAAGRGTMVVLTHTRFPTDDVRDKHGVGWQACMDNLDTRVLGVEEVTAQ